MNDPLRPADFARLLLSSGDLLPRQRARDQQADRAGMEIKQRVLNAVVERDPEPEEMEAALVGIVEELGPPTGPARAIAVGILEEWRLASATPEWLAQLLGEAVRYTGDK
ncbi:MAG TPA: hypothetical protein VGZ47_04855 [Gemmataceae bacterium]|jgi:hypothetical protein|nr:hypothetical protein [Gemmataceae bacterium]